MGYHTILCCTTIIKPEYLDCIKKEYFIYKEYVNIYDNKYEDEDEDEEKDTDEDERPPEKWLKFYKIWRDLCIWGYDGNGGFYKFKLEGDRFTFELSAKTLQYDGPRCYTLLEAYKLLMHDIIAPMSSEILRCYIEQDYYGLSFYNYTDEEIRNF